ncbi:MAG: ribose ABC transporter permease, partial [Nitrososphaerota archaeon]|nr:ribose ABC transporter permease [Nitrososphaerota archaeon]
MLVSEEIANRLVEEAGISREDVVLEIGAGSGIITKRLAKKAKEVVSYEVDRDLYEHTKRVFSSIENLVLKLGDA